MFENRSFLVILASEHYHIDYQHILDEGLNSLTSSVDDSYHIIKWDNVEPPFLHHFTQTHPVFTHEEVIEHLFTDNWHKGIDDNYTP